MRKIWSREHFERRINRYYLLAVHAKLPEIKKLHIDRARHYRKLWSVVPALAG